MLINLSEQFLNGTTAHYRLFIAEHPLVPEQNFGNKNNLYTLENAPVTLNYLSVSALAPLVWQTANKNLLQLYSQAWSNRN